MTSHDARPEPLVDAETDLSGFNRFMLDVDRLLASELVAVGTPEECWSAVMLWCRAWKQSPVASLPNDDKILAAFSGAGKRWPKVKKMALRGFIECSDGRLYHKVLAAEAHDAWQRRKKFQDRSAKANDRRWNRGDDAQGSKDGRPSPPNPIQQGVLQGLQEGAKMDYFEDPTRPRRDKTGQDKTTSSSNASADASTMTVNDLHAKLVDAAGGHVAQTVGIEVVKPILDLMAQGYDLDRHILPAVRATVPRLSKPLGNWGATFLRDEIMAMRNQDSYRATPGARKADDEPTFDFGGGFTPTYSTIKMVWEQKRWIPDWGPRPDEPGCRIPPNLLAEIMGTVAA